MSLQNIAQVTYVEGIEKLLKEGPTRFVILALTLDTTPLSTKIYIRKWLKATSKKFPNILFLYFCAKDDDLGKMNLLPEDTKDYPYIYHIVDTKNILVKVDGANPSTIVESFSQVEKHYIKDLEKSLSNENNDDEITNDDNDENNNEQNSENNNKKNEDMKKIMLKQREIQQNNKLEQKKLMEKVNVLNECADKFRKKFLKDIKKRKLEES